MFIKDHQKTALIDNDKKISYEELLKNINYYSTLYKIAPGDRVVVFSEAQPGWFYSFYSIWKGRGIATPFDAAAQADEIAFQIDDCEPKVIFCSENTQPVLKEAIKIANHKPKVIVFEKIKPMPEDKFEAEAVEGGESDETAVMIYTSGTTGKPKGVMLTFGNLMSNIDRVANVELSGVKDTHFFKDDVTLTILPLQHILPLQGTMIMPLFVGATICILGEINSAEIIRLMKTYGVTYIIGVPRLFIMFYNSIMEKINSSGIAKLLFKIARGLKSDKFSKKIFKKVGDQFGGKVKYFLTGGSKMPPEIRRDFYALGIPLYEGYGLSETSPVISRNIPNSGYEAVGLVMHGYEVKIVDGEIVFRGSNVMKGYYNRPEETAAVLKDGWFYTGDRGYFDKKGRLVVAGRIKDIIVLANGKNINPAEIEEKLIQAYPSIQEIGVTEKNGQLFAVVYPNKRYMVENEIHHVQEHFKWDVFDKYNLTTSEYKKIFNFEVVDLELPKTRIGKLKRFELKNLIGQKKKQRKEIAHPNTPEYRIIHDYLENRFHLPIAPNDHIELDLALDSLDRLQLIEKINQTFGTGLTNKDLAKHPVLENLAEHIKNVKTKIDNTRVNWSKILKERIEGFQIPKRPTMMNTLIALTKPFMFIYFRLRNSGREFLPKDSPVIIAPNHQSFLDGLVVSMSLKRRFRNKTYYIAKSDHFESKFRKRFANRANILIININSNLKDTLQKSAELLSKGNNLVIFPEGARTRDGNLQKFKESFAILSKELNVPIIPTVIDGTYRSFSIGKKIPRPGKITVRFLESVSPEGKTYEELVSIAEEKISEVLKAQ